MDDEDDGEDIFEQIKKASQEWQQLLQVRCSAEVACHRKAVEAHYEAARKGDGTATPFDETNFVPKASQETLDKISRVEGKIEKFKSAVDKTKKSTNKGGMASKFPKKSESAAPSKSGK